MSLFEEVSRFIEQCEDPKCEDFDVYESREYVKIYTSSLNRHRNHFVIYVTEQVDGSFKLSDDGETLSDLKQSGISFESPEKMKLLRMFIGSPTVKTDGIDLETEATSDDFISKMLSLLRAMEDAEDLRYSNPFDNMDEI